MRSAANSRMNLAFEFNAAAYHLGAGFHLF
jgi:hypothetical protein